MAYESLLFMQNQSMPALHQHAIPGKATWDGNTTKMTKIECSRIKSHKTMTKSLRILAIIAAVCCYAQWIDARVYYVKTDGTGNGDSWQEAAGDLDEMMEKASSGDEIWIAKGVYKPTRLIKASKKNSRAFVLKDGVSLYGGFAGNESSIAQREKGWQAYSFTNETVLSGDDDVEDVWTRTFMNATDYLYGWEVENNMIPGTENNSNHILYSSSTLEHPTTINGITLKGGNACVWNVKAAGGAVYDSGNVRIESCKVMENSAYFTAESAAPHTLGGAVYLDGSDGAAITDCLFARNYSHSSYGAGVGGAVYAKGTNIERCTFEECVALDNGGAVYNDGGTLKDCTFTNCYAAAGGAVYNDGNIDNCKAYGCKALKGGAIYNLGTVRNTIVANCKADTRQYGDDNGGKGGGIYNQSGWVDNVAAFNNLSYQGGGIFVENGKLTNVTALNNEAIDTAHEPNVAFGETASEAGNTENSIFSKDTEMSNFNNPTTFTGMASNDDQLNIIMQADWNVAYGAPLAGQGYSDNTASGIRHRPTIATDNSQAWNLNGQKAGRSHRGIAIRGGKKTIMMK